MSMSSYLRVWYYPYDPELKIIHCFTDCGGLKFPKKYRYMKETSLRGIEDAQFLDSLLSTGYKVCVPCYKRELVLSRKDKRPMRPGFKTPPAEYKPDERYGRQVRTTERDNQSKRTRR